MSRPSPGFSLLEVLAVISIMTAVSVVAIIQLLPGIRSDSALEQVMIQLRQARLSSVDERRDFTVTFRGNNEVVVVRQEVPNGTTTISDTFLPHGVIYMLFGALPDTPDAFGKTYPLNFTCPSHTTPCSILFQSDGTVLANGVLINGTVFMGVAGSTNSARAVTVMGGTGRIHGFHSNGASWF
jgi:prepilin-type N-terminal cleavage/methylation domain-containing protein